MKNKKTRYIKCVKNIPEQEFRDIPVFQSIMRIFDSNNGTHAENHNRDFKFVVDRDGELVERDIDEIVCRPDDFLNAFSEDRTVMGVKLVWSDGVEEYGFKSWQSKEILHKRNGNLVSIYTKDGVFNEDTGEIEDIFDFDNDCRLPLWIMKLLPMWNEKIRDGVTNRDRSIETKFVSLDDWAKVCEVFNSSYTRNSTQWKEVTVAGKKTMRPVSVEFDQHKWFTSAYSSWKDVVCNEEFGQLYQMIEKDAVKVFCYSYLKSIYKDSYTRRKVYDVFPISSLLMIKKHKWSGDTHDYIDTEMWNSLDEACKGNV